MPAIEIFSTPAIDSAPKSTSANTNTSASDSKSFKDAFEQESHKSSVSVSEKESAVNGSSSFSYRQGSEPTDADVVKAGAEGAGIDSITVTSSGFEDTEIHPVGMPIYTLQPVSVGIVDSPGITPTLESIEQSHIGSALQPFNPELLAGTIPRTHAELESGSELLTGLGWNAKSFGTVQGLSPTNLSSESGITKQAISDLSGGNSGLVSSAGLSVAMATKTIAGASLVEGVSAQAIDGNLVSAQNNIAANGSVKSLVQPFIKAFEGNLGGVASSEVSTTLPDLSPASDIGSTGLSSTKIPGLETLEQQTARFSVNVQFGKPEWNAGITSKVAQMAAQNLNFAEIQLDPPELGPLQVRIQMNQDQASVSFTASSPQVREALEQGNNRLREMLESEGLNLVDVDVKDQGQKDKDSDLESDHAEAQLADAEEQENSLSSVIQSSTEIKLGVDDFV